MMADHHLYLVDQSSARLAVLDVEPRGDLYHGRICLDTTPRELMRIFNEFEEMVEGQMFSLADQLEEKIDAFGLRILFPNGTESPVEDLQVFPRTNRVSFKVREPLEQPDSATDEQVAGEVHH